MNTLLAQFVGCLLISLFGQCSCAVNKSLQKDTMILSAEIRNAKTQVTINNNTKSCINEILEKPKTSTSILTLQFAVNSNAPQNSFSLDIYLNDEHRDSLYLSSITIVGSPTDSGYKTDSSINRYAIEMNSFLLEQQNEKFFRQNRVNVMFYLSSQNIGTTKKVILSNVSVTCQKP